VQLTTVALHPVTAHATPPIVTALFTFEPPNLEPEMVRRVPALPERGTTFVYAPVAAEVNAKAAGRVVEAATTDRSAVQMYTPTSTTLATPMLGVTTTTWVSVAETTKPGTPLNATTVSVVFGAKPAPVRVMTAPPAVLPLTTLSGAVTDSGNV
jgi:hypothetical protein